MCVCVCVCARACVHVCMCVFCPFQDYAITQDPQGGGWKKEGKGGQQIAGKVQEQFEGARTGHTS